MKASGNSWLTPPPPCTCMAQSSTCNVMFGTATLISAMACLAALLPTVSIMNAACSTSSRAWSILMRASAMRSSVTSWSAMRLPKATRLIERLHISSSARSATPIWRMQWWMRPGPRRPWAISKPRPSPSRRLPAGTRTFSKRTSVAVRRVVVAEDRQHPLDRDALAVARHHDHRLLLVLVGILGIRLAHEDQDLAARVADARGPPLVAVDHVLGAVAHDGRFEVGGVGRRHL